MKQNVHPTYYSSAKVVCACGNSFVTGSTVEEIRIEICSNCHPFYTGNQKLIDTAGRVDRFQKRAAKSANLTAAKKEKKPRVKKLKLDETISLKSPKAEA